MTPTLIRPEDAIDPEVTARLHALPEDRALDWFWLMLREHVDPLSVLLQMGQVRIQRPAGWDPAAIRRQHEQQGGRTTYALRRCLGCLNSGVRLYSHHIIEVYHGGSNAARNQAPLCFDCHQYLHPWLKDEPAYTSRRGFENLSDRKSVV